MKTWISSVLKGGKRKGTHQPFDLPLDDGDGLPAPCMLPDPPAAKDLEGLHSSIATMPKPSWVWHQIQAAIAARASLREIGHIIAKDTALTAEMIRAANAPAFELVKPIVNVERAVSHLGTNMVRSISTRQSLSTGLFKGAAFFEQKQLWCHSMAVSALAEVIARHVPHCNAAEAGTLGLLHDMGRMLLNHAIDPGQAEANTLQLQSHGFLHWEAATAGCTHIEAGIMLARAWELPEQLIQAIRHHHDPAFSEPGDVPKVVRHEVFAVYLADLLAIHLKFPGGNPCKTMPLASWAPMLSGTSLNELATSERVSKALWMVFATDF